MYNRSREIIVTPSYSRYSAGEDILYGGFISQFMKREDPVEYEIFGIYENSVINFGNLNNLRNDRNHMVDIYETHRMEKYPGHYKKNS